MEDDEVLNKKFEKDVLWLRKNLAPDDVYAFCQQTLIAASFFCRKWQSGEDYYRALVEDPLTKLWISNVIGLLSMQQNEINGMINTDLDAWGYE